ncbi:type II secretion system F family protein [Aliiglaciecola sp. CAU 1673]|uniref:type II secretion system F family protein n=1 Tax=Aliiglaciecola sp. CAU 1673 TaxID=3032595 RepID=UPI0023DCA3CC|nr:type II secretion system F family protein [Aliiglaciecola sp. CAU 1673]MDF2177509.1 type II secretion system F family protein [Aliiglaciecola sp. CAU 1673]
MQLFRIKAYNSAGELLEKDELAADEAVVKRRLAEQGLTAISISAINTQEQGHSAANFSLKELEVFISNLADLLKSGVKLDKAFGILERGAPSKALKYFIAQFRQSIRQGQSFTDKAKQFPHLFNRLYISLLQVGEATGDLAGAVSRITEDLKFRIALKEELQRALTYPAVVLFVCILAITFIFQFVLPQLAPLFEEAKELPWYTHMLLNVANFMEAYGVVVIAGIILTPLLLVAVLPGLLRNSDQFKNLVFNLPFVSSMLRVVDRIRFSSALHLTLKSGVSLDEAMQLAANAVAYPLLRESLISAIEKIKQGARISDSLEPVRLYDNIQLGFIETGEETGDMASAFENVANRSQQLFKQRVSTLTTLLEPMLILFMGLIVGGIVIVMIMSIMATQDISL